MKFKMPISYSPSIGRLAKRNGNIGFLRKIRKAQIRQFKSLKVYRAKTKNLF